MSPISRSTARRRPRVTRRAARHGSRAASTSNTNRRRKSGRLKPLAANLLSPDAAAAYHRHLVARGQREAQLKVLTLQRRQDCAFDFSAFASAPRMPRRRVTIASAPIPFRAAFKHASATRRVAENVIVRIEDDDGLVGLGEGLPAPYVTGETVATATSFSTGARPTSSRASTRSRTSPRGSPSDDEIDANPSAACAIELRPSRPPRAPRRVRSSACSASIRLPSAPMPPRSIADFPRRSSCCSLVFGWRGLRDQKLKLSGDPRRDRWRARLLARRGPLRPRRQQPLARRPFRDLPPRPSGDASRGRSRSRSRSATSTQ